MVSYGVYCVSMCAPLMTQRCKFPEIRILKFDSTEFRLSYLGFLALGYWMLLALHQKTLVAQGV